MTEPQECFAEDCEATYAAPVLEHTGLQCPECGVPSIQCPICETIVSLDALLDENACPWCGEHRLALGDAVREATDDYTLEVGQS